MKGGLRMRKLTSRATLLIWSIAGWAILVAAFLSGSAAQTGGEPTLLFTIGVHVEPLGTTAQGYRSGRGDYNNPQFFQRHVEDLYELADLVERHGGKLTIQVQTPFTTAAARFDSPVLRDLEARGHELALHFHEDAHLGRDPERLPPERWCAVMREEIEAIRQAGVRGPIRYWSGGNLYPELLEAASCAGLDINGDWKDPRTQSSHQLVIGVSPWRPAGGPDPDDLTAFATHDPHGPVIYLPDGLLDLERFRRKREIIAEGGAEAWFDVIRDDLLRSLAAARADRVNVFHFTVHPGEFRGDPSAAEPFAVIDQFLTDVVDPLVAQGRVRWATFSEMADAFIAWEQGHPGVDPRAAADTGPSEGAPDDECRGYMTFAINVHDFKNLDESADTLHHLIDIFERYGVRGDFYFTAPMVHFYEERRPDIIERLKDSAMTISYHVRPPHPLVAGFDGRLWGLSAEEREQMLRDYETYRLDMTTGGLLRDEPGGYSYVKAVFGRAPVVASVPSARWRDVALPLFAEMGARMTVIYHETGTKPDQPFEWTHGLLIRPSDFSVTRWSVPGGPQDAFWWNQLDTPYADAYNPRKRLQRLLNDWAHERPPFITALIHENNFYRRGATPWAFVYYEDRQKTRPKSPPYDLNAPDASRPRTPENEEQIWVAYEELVQYAAEHLCVVTSEDIVEMAEDAGR